MGREKRWARKGEGGSGEEEGEKREGKREGRGAAVLDATASVPGSTPRGLPNAGMPPRYPGLEVWVSGGERATEPGLNPRSLGQGLPSD